MLCISLTCYWGCAQQCHDGQMNTNNCQEMQRQQYTHCQGQPPQPDIQLLSPYTGYSPAPVSFQQERNNNVVVATQPTATPPVTIVNPQPKPKPIVMVVTIVLTVVCLVQGCWPALVCLAPGLIAAVVGFALSDSASAEQRHTAKAFHAVAVCCNIASVVYYVVGAISLTVTLAVIFGASSQNQM